MPAVSGKTYMRFSKKQQDGCPQRERANVQRPGCCNTPIYTDCARWQWQNFGGASLLAERFADTEIIIRHAKQNANLS